MRKPAFTCRQMMDALEKTGGVQTLAAQAIGCHRDTVASYIKKHPTVRRAAESSREKNLDIAEAGLLAFLRGGIEGQKSSERLDAIKFYLRTKGRGRGYGDRLDVLVEQGMEREMETVFDVLQRFLSEEQYVQILHALDKSDSGEAQA